MEMSKVFKFDKIAYASSRRVNSPEVEMRLHYKDGGYKYGSSWMYREIPENDLNEIISLLSE